VQLVHGLLCFVYAGMSALTTLSRLTRLALRGNGFGIKELAMKVTNLLRSLVCTCNLLVVERTACRGSPTN
jgi:hypothetical protein